MMMGNKLRFQVYQNVLDIHIDDKNECSTIETIRC
jgi:hypothetical protein